MSSSEQAPRYSPVRRQDGKVYRDALLLVTEGEVPPLLREQLDDQTRADIEWLEENQVRRTKQARAVTEEAERRARQYEQKNLQESQTQD